MITIALDAMGGDHAPVEIVKGAIAALKEDSELHITLFGRSDQVDLSHVPDSVQDRLDFEHAEDVVEMCESPAISFKKKPKSSIRLGLEAVKEGRIQSFVSAGNTGAVMSTSTLVLKRIRGIERPAIGTLLPSTQGHVLVLDVGSNMDAKPKHLQQFALMGHFFSQLILGIKKPRVGLLNVGEEAEKGDSLTQAAYGLIQKLDIKFIGNIEGRDMLFDTVDVVVCDGFVGNVLLKFGEGVAAFFIKTMRAEAKKSWFCILGALLMKPALRRLKKRIDYEEVGGAPLLGLNGVSVIAHGSSHAKAIKNACFTARDMVKQDTIGWIKKAIQ